MAEPIQIHRILCSIDRSVFSTRALRHAAGLVTEAAAVRHADGV